jgi:flagellar basal-body rod protein FlgF
VIRGIYTLASGMLHTERQVDVTTNNLANVNTAGFKKDLLVAMAAPNMATVREPLYPRAPSDPYIGSSPIGTQSTGIVGDVVWTDYSPGAIVQTGRNLDLASLSGGFFTIQDSGGNTYYTRNGSFTLNADGALVTQDGLNVLGENGLINLAGAQRVEVSQNGAIIADGETVDVLRMSFFNDPNSLRKVGNTRFAGGNPDAVGVSSVESGVLEQSNANVIDSMVKLIEGHRMYEADSRVLQTLDTTLERSVNDVGSVK